MIVGNGGKMEDKETTSANENTMTVRLEDGSEAQRPFSVRRGTASVGTGGSAQPSEVRVPFTYPGEEAIAIEGGWLIRRLRK